VKLLDKGGAVEELLKIEEQLGRVTGEIERLKGKIKYYKHAVAFSTLTVRLNSALPQKALEEVIPFGWIRNLGSEVKLASHSSFSPPKSSRNYFRLALPDSYVKVYEDKSYARIYSGDGISVLVKKEQNFRDANLGFWKKMVRRWLTASKVISIVAEREIQSSNEVVGSLIVGTKTIARDDYGYLLAIFTSSRAIYTIEAWGLKETMENDSEALIKMTESLSVK
ncbi:MAG: DUF4349 domain-containing protein, partial [Verrucomicrobiota bacterium]